MKTIIAIVVAIAILFEYYILNAATFAQAVIIPVLAKFLSGRKVLMVYDSDGSKPEKVEVFQSCARGLAGALSGIGSKLRTVFIPGSSNGEKQGLDDYLLTHSQEQFWELVKNGVSKVAPSAAKWKPRERSFTTTNGSGESVDLGGVVERQGEPFIISNVRNTVSVSLNQTCLAEIYGARNRILYEPLEKCFYKYDWTSGLWRAMAEEAVTYDISSETRSYAVECFPDEPELVTQITKTRNGSTMSAVMNFAKGAYCKVGAFCSRLRRGAIHTLNCMLLIDPAKGVETVEFSPDFFSRNQIPILFDPNAECPEFLEFLNGELDSDDVDLLQRWSGTAAMGGNPSQSIGMLTGRAGGGKGTFSEIIEEMLGRSNVTELRTEHLAERFEIGRYAGKTLLCGKDVPGNFLETKGAYALKKLSGHDWLTGELKNANAGVDFRAEAAILITSNERLHISLGGADDIQAWSRRVFIVRYDRPARARKDIARYSRQLVQREGSGILNWIIAGALAYCKDTEEHGARLVLTEAQRARVDDLLLESRSVEVFLRECVEERPGATLSVEEAVEGLYAYCGKRKWRAGKLRDVQVKLGESVQELFNIPQNHSSLRDGKNVRGWRGICLKEGIQ